VDSIFNHPQAAMAEDMSSTHSPDQKFLAAYGEWADGDWGMVLTGERDESDARIIVAVY
jgi:2,4-dienoyl-CoA reductase-like NADH-dependent reductase (Old Yellow Enzyme family)